MPFHRARLDAVALEPRRHVVVFQAIRSEPVFERGDGAVVFKWAAIPDAFERRYFVIARAAPCLQRQTRVSADRHGQDVVFLFVFGRHAEAINGREFVIRIKRRRVASGASLALKNLLSTLGERVELVRIRRRLELIQIHRQRIQLLVTVTYLI